MATSNIEKALTVIKGIGEGNHGLATTHIHPKKYLLHSSFADGDINALKTYISNASHEKHRLNVIRKFEDGAYVFTQEDGEILGQNTFFEVFKFENDLIVEHWIFADKSALPNKSGHTQVDGPVEAKHEENTEKNKAMMRDYYETVHIAGDHSKIPQYFSGDVCIRHEPDVEDGVAAFTRDVEAAKNHRTIDKLDFLLAQGNFVFITAQGTFEGDAVTYVDLYRVEDLKIAEHWGFIEKVSQTEE